MNDDKTTLNFDPEVEDSEKLRQISRRFFLGVLGTAAGTALVSCSSDQVGNVANAESATPDLNSLPKAPAPDDEKAWETIAGQFLIKKDLAYMNTGTRGPSPRYIHMAQIRSLEGIDSDYKGYTTDVYNKDFRTALRKKLADFVGARPNEVAFMNNTTDGMITGTYGPVMQRGDQIIYTNHDHSGGTHPVLQRASRDGLEVKVVDLTDPKYHPPQNADDIVKAFEAVMTPRTRLISFCHVNYTDGLVMPVKAICEMARARGVLTLVDGAQPPGMMKLNLSDLGCDMYAGPFHKWMMSSMYTGFFYVREDMIERIEPILSTMTCKGLNMYGVQSKEAFFQDVAGTAGQYELRGSSHYPSRLAMDAALDFHNHLTPEAIEARDRYLARRLMDGLKKINGIKLNVSEDPQMSCALVSFNIEGVDPEGLNKVLWDNHHIYIRNVKHDEISWNANRASMHIMVTAAQVDKLLGAIEEVARTPSMVQSV